MAALSGITAVRPTANTKFILCMYGATIAAGESVYRDATDSDKAKLADSNVSAAAASVRGIAMTPGVSGGYGQVATEGSIILVGTTMAVGSTYYVGQTAGSLVPDSDLATNDWVSRVGTAASATQLDLSIKATGIQHA